MNIFRVRSLVNWRVTTTDYWRVTTRDYWRVTTRDYPYGLSHYVVGAILYGCPQSFMVAPNPLWLPPILYGCPQSFMVALVDYFLRVA